MLYQLSYGGARADCIKNGCLVKKFFYTYRMITLIAVTDSYKHFDESIREYEKRIQKFVTIKKIKPISHTNSEYIKVKETLLIIEALKKLP